jgi:hypothetical protein
LWFSIHWNGAVYIIWFHGFLPALCQKPFVAIQFIYERARRVAQCQEIGIPMISVRLVIAGNPAGRHLMSTPDGYMSGIYTDGLHGFLFRLMVSELTAHPFDMPSYLAVNSQRGQMQYDPAHMAA